MTEYSLQRGPVECNGGGGGHQESSLFHRLKLCMYIHAELALLQKFLSCFYMIMPALRNSSNIEMISFL